MCDGRLKARVSLLELSSASEPTHARRRANNCGGGSGASSPQAWHRQATRSRPQPGTTCKPELEIWNLDLETVDSRSKLVLEESELKPNKPNRPKLLHMNQIREKGEKQTQLCYPQSHQCFTAIFGLVFEKYE